MKLLFYKVLFFKNNMRPRYSFSSRRTGRIAKMRKQREKYPDLLMKIVEDSDIILEILDARFPEETRNKEIEDKINKLDKKIIYVLNKSDLTTLKKIKEFKLYPRRDISCKERKGIRKLRNLIKELAKKVKKKKERTAIGIIGYPNTGKSSLINILIGKASAGTGAQAGFTRGIQKLKLDENTILLDSPGVIPKEKYSPIEKEKIAKHTKVGGRSYSQVKEPDLVIMQIMKDHPNVLEKFYKIKSNNNSEILIEKIGKKKGFIKKGGKVNEDTTSRYILKDWQEGKIKI